MNRHYDYAPPSDFQNRSPFASYHSAASVQAPPHHHHQERRHPPRGDFTGNNTYNNGGSSVDSPAMLQTSTLFLGDLSVNCDEERLFDLFCQFGEIETVQLKKSERDPQRTHLGFGFIKFTTREAAERALNALNGYFFLGRALRVGWAEDYDKRNHQRLKTGKTSNTYFPRTMDPKKNRQTAQIHITFVSRELNKRVSEVELGDVFGRFGNLIDIAIKKNAINPDQHTQSGYAFVHYNLTDEGVRSAVMAVEQTNNRNYDHMAFQSKVTHSLQAHIFAMKYRGGAGAGGPPAPPQAAPTFSEPRSNFNYPPRAPFSAPSTYSDPSISPPTHYLGESSYTSSSGYVISPPQTTSTYHQNFDYSPPQHSSHAPSSYYTDTSSSTYQQNLPPAAASIYDHHSIIVNDEYSLMKGNSPSNSRSPSHSNSTTDRFPTNNNTMFAMDATFYETIPAGRSNSFTTGSNNNSITGENEEDLVHHLTSL